MFCHGNRKLTKTEMNTNHVLGSNVDSKPWTTTLEIWEWGLDGSLLGENFSKMSARKILEDRILEMKMEFNNF